ncbi:class I histocompatibility antigen, Non-RT1.A alpha-1 chain-like isoform X3 [Ictalurus furcatus]|uniref:class I histocompatibility antigen, Non-RT1.A alpha-1 chain-like isoform X3 n=1 Tax=Ictalurus furcatus TaxID=66913 RepID=UPI00234FDD45|nr:class I histocompatibility antigen, Non-RT1.A alpha-1 chain-like isoform X3 [Ictalurus furcatus]
MYMMGRIVVLVILLGCGEMSTGTHSLQYLFTVLTPGTDFPNFTVVGLLDGEPFEYYDNKTGEIIPKMAWIEKCEHENYWKKQKIWIKGNEEDLKPFLSAVMKHFNNSKGFHTWQWMSGCELYDDRITQVSNQSCYDDKQFVCDGNSTRVYDQSCFDGEHVITLDLKNLIWNTTSDKARALKNQWEATGHRVLDHKHDLIKKCIKLCQYLSWGRKILERKVRPEASLFQKNSSSPEVVCHATCFFPNAVNITWQKDGEDVHEDVDLRETLPNQDGSFQKRSILTVTAEDLQKHNYTCVIQHSSLEKEMVLPVSERRILNPGGRSGGGSDGGSMELTGICWIVVAVFAFALVLSLPALMECLFGVQGYLVRGGEGHL